MKTKKIIPITSVKNNSAFVMLSICSLGALLISIIVFSVIFIRTENTYSNKMDQNTKIITSLKNEESTNYSYLNKKLAALNKQQEDNTKDIQNLKQ
jgi:mannitol-specific phosphotransferase system IIBC component